MISSAHLVLPNGPLPSVAVERDAWIRAERPDLDGVRRYLPTDRPAAWLWECEPDGARGVRPVLTVFLTNRECPWRCLMCDLWRHTTLDPVPPGQIPCQIDVALEAAGPVPPRTRLKLYNAGSFFDLAAIPVADYPAIAHRCQGFESVLVECHPSLVRNGERIREFAESILPARLEVAMGLETAHPEILRRLNKRMTLEGFSAATRVLRDLGCATRAFVLVQPPFLPPALAVEWAERSASFAFSSGIQWVTLIPTRGGNGALERLRDVGAFKPPTLSCLEDAVDAAMTSRAGMLLADVWDLERFSEESSTFQARRDRLELMNQLQCVLPRVGAN